MAQVNNETTMGFSPNMCDYCQQRPKFSSYNYCSRTCGALATAIGNRPAPVMCKLCNQRPVYQNHKFCGRNCAKAWAAEHGQINTGSLGILWPSSWYHSTAQGQQQGGNVVRGFVQGFRSLISPTNQIQQQQTVTDPAQTRQPPNNTANPTSTLTTTSPITVLPSAPSNQLSPGTSQHPFNLLSPTNGGTSNQNNNGQLDPFDVAYPIPPPPTDSILSGSPVLQIANRTDLDPSQTTPNSAQIEMSLPSYSPGGADYMFEPDDSNTNALLGPYPDREPGKNGDEGAGDEMLMDVDVLSVKSFAYPPSVSTSEKIPGICSFEGCSNPTFVDSITDLEGEYCSRKHQEEAMVFKQAAASCILCRRMPRGLDDHFCSVGCRARALSP